MARRIFSGWPQFGAGFARLDQAQIAPFGHLDVALDFDVAQMEAVLVGAGGHVGGAAQGFVRVHGQILHPDRAQAAGMGAQRRKNLLRLGRAEGRRAERAGQLRLVQLMVAAQQNQRRLVLRRYRPAS